MFKTTLKQDSNRMMLRHILRQCVTAKYGPDPDKLIIERVSREWQAMEQKASIFSATVNMVNLNMMDMTFYGRSQ